MLDRDVVMLEEGATHVLFHRRSLRAVRVDDDEWELARWYVSPQTLPSTGAARVAAVELHNSGFLVSADPIMDYSEMPPATPVPHAHIDTYRIVLTEACNLACTYCFEKDIAPSKRSMSQETLDGVVDRISERHVGESVAIHWFGGEPLLRFAQIQRGVERLAAGGEMGVAHAAHSITTHGGLVTPEIAEWMAKHDFSAYVSLDGDRQQNDEHRVSRNGLGTYHEALRGYYRLKARGLSTGIILTPHGQNVHRLLDAVRHFVEDIGCTRLAINTPQPTENGWGLDGGEFARQLLSIARYCQTNNVMLTAPNQRIVHALITRQPQTYDCRAPQGSMAVSIAPDGTMGFCIVSWNDPEHRASLSDSDAFDRARAWKLRTHLTATCRSCIAEQVCGGPCALEAQLGELDASRCDFFRTYLREALVG